MFRAITTRKHFVAGGISAMYAIQALFFYFLPSPQTVHKLNRINMFGRKPFMSFCFRYHFRYHNLQKKIIAWHRAELETLDSRYAFELAQKKLVRARQLAHENGMDPFDLDYPELSDFWDFDKNQLITRG